jgi:hypothetical protein
MFAVGWLKYDASKKYQAMLATTDVQLRRFLILCELIP